MSIATPTQTTCRVQSPWKGTGTKGDPYRPQVVDDHQWLNWQDTSGSPGGAGTVTITGTMTNAQYDAMLANPTYTGKITFLGTS